MISGMEQPFEGQIQLSDNTWTPGLRWEGHEACQRGGWLDESLMLTWISRKKPRLLSTRAAHRGLLTP